MPEAHRAQVALRWACLAHRWVARRRRAADLLHLHHSSVARRLDQLGKTLGIELTEPTGLTRARLALTAWRLLND